MARSRRISWLITAIIIVAVGYGRSINILNDVLVITPDDGEVLIFNSGL